MNGVGWYVKYQNGEMMGPFEQWLKAHDQLGRARERSGNYFIARLVRVIRCRNCGAYIETEPGQVYIVCESCNVVQL